MFINTRNMYTNTSSYVQIILVLLHLHQPVLCINGVANSLHIMEHLAIHQLKVHFITYARCVDLNVCTYCDFLLPVSIILAANHKCFQFSGLYLRE